MASGAISVKKPNLPRWIPITEISNSARVFAALKILPSPPTTTAKSHCLPISSRLTIGNLGLAISLEVSLSIRAGTLY